MTDDKVYFLDDVDADNVTNEIWKGLNSMYSRISHLVNYKYHLILYRLVKKGYVKVTDLQDATGYSRQRIYQIIAEFEKREVERTNNEKGVNNS